MRARWIPLGTLLAHIVLPAQSFVVVGPDEWRAAAEPLLARRGQQGLAVEWLAPRADLRQALHERVRRSERPGYVLLLGDAPALPSLERPGLPAIVPRMPGSETVASDLGYVDVADDGAPSWTIGRIPARDPRELATVVAKMLAYEQAPAGAWQREVSLVAGDGNFGAVLDTVLGGAMRQLFAEELAPSFVLAALIALPESPFFVPEERFGASVIERLDAGPLAFVYAGHGALDRFANLRLSGSRRSWPLLRIADVDSLQHAERTILMAYACHIGEFDKDCLGEALLRHAHGPVAVLAASQVSFPFGDLLLGRELMRAQAGRDATRLGDWIRIARARLMHADAKDPFHVRAGTLAGFLGLNAEQQDALRRYTADLYHLLGDPALVLPSSGAIELALERKAVVGEPLLLRVGAPCRVRIELCRDRGQQPDDVLATKELEPGATRCELAWPAPITGGMLVVRAFGQDGGRVWLGGLRFAVKRG